jgi:hypothetical protein
MNLWLGSQVLWLLWHMRDLEGWSLGISIVLVLGSVLCLVQIERSRRQVALARRAEAAADRT